MRLQLVNPPEVPGFSSDRDKAGGLGTMLPLGRYPTLPNVPPLDLMYAAAIAERLGVSVEIIDALGERLSSSQVLARLQAGPEDVTGIRIALPSLGEDLKLAQRIRERVKGRVFVFGSALQTYRERIPGIDAFEGEAEALIQDYLAGNPLPSEWAYQASLDDLPFPAWHLVKLANYCPQGEVSQGVFYLSTSRGCPRGCPMCPYALHQGSQWRFQSPQRVLAEIDWLYHLGIRALQTRDPNIGIDRKRLEAIAEGLIQRPYRMRIAIETDLETLDESLLQKLGQAGVTRILTGLESGSEECLEDLNQNYNALERSLANIQRCQRLGIEVVGFLVFGTPSESYQSIQATIAMAKQLPIRYSTSLMTPYPGTPMREEIAEQGHLFDFKDFHQFGGTSCLVGTNNLSREQLGLAYRWSQEELDLAARKRDLARYQGMRRTLATLGYFRDRLYHLPTSHRFHQLRFLEHEP